MRALLLRPILSLANTESRSLRLSPASYLSAAERALRRPNSVALCSRAAEEDERTSAGSAHCRWPFPDGAFGRASALWLCLLPETGFSFSASRQHLKRLVNSRHAEPGVTCRPFSILPWLSRPLLGLVSGMVAAIKGRAPAALTVHVRHSNFLGALKLHLKIQLGAWSLYLHKWLSDYTAGSTCFTQECKRYLAMNLPQCVSV